MCRFDTKQLVDKLKKELGFGWWVYPINLYSDKTEKTDRKMAYSGPIYCVHCGNYSITEIFQESYNAVTGGSTEWVFRCNTCNKYMTVVNEQG